MTTQENNSPPPTEPTTPPPTTTTPPDKGSPSLLNEPTTEPDKAAPESYSDFTFPEGYEANEETLTEAKGLFKELGLPQVGAQKLVDFYSKMSQQAAEAPLQLWQAKQEEWRNEIKADSELGGKLDQVRSTIAKAIDGLGDPKLAQAFREAMDYTGAGNNPAFIRGFYKLAQKVTEGSPVSGNPPNTAKKPQSAAAAMYPNLPSGA